MFNFTTFIRNFTVVLVLATAFAGCKGKSGGGGGFTPAPATGPTSQLTINPLSVDSSGLYHVTGNTESLTGGSPSPLVISITVNGAKVGGGDNIVGSFDFAAVANQASDVQISAVHSGNVVIEQQAVTGLSGELTSGGQPHLVKFGGGE